MPHSDSEPCCKYEGFLSHLSSVAKEVGLVLYHWCGATLFKGEQNSRWATVPVLHFVTIPEHWKLVLLRPGLQLAVLERTVPISGCSRVVCEAFGSPDHPSMS